jgi:predicted ATP-grasp superfamily ATP-dependent carboligase
MSTVRVAVLILRSTQRQIQSNDILLNQKQTALPYIYTANLTPGPLVSLGSP